MNTYQPWLDRDLAELVRAQPQLVAVADALAEADGRSAARTARLSRRRRYGLAGAVVAAAAALALLLPWGGSNGRGFADRALAAIGTEPVLHVVTEQPSGQRLIDLKTGEATTVTLTNEIWYDRAKSLVHTLSRSGGVVIGDALETPDGGYTESGPVIDCAWIAAHPVEATRRRVSCNANGDNGKTPRKVERPIPTIDPPLAAFLDGYRDAVARGLAHRVEGGDLDGRQVVWLSFPIDNGRTEEVALDPLTYRPLYVRMPGGGWEYRIRSIESVGFDPANFERPKIDERAARIGSGGVFERTVVELDANALKKAYPAALWAGRAVAGLPLVAIERDELTSKYGSGEVEHGVGIRLVYGSARDGNPDWSRPFIEIAESRQPQPAYRWGFLRGALPPEGKLYMDASGGGPSFGFMVDGGVYVSIWGADDSSVIAAARDLTPVAD